jgi:hypothetical protein
MHKIKLINEVFSLINFINFVKRNFLKGKASYKKNVKLCSFFDPLLYFDPINYLIIFQL